MSKQTTATALSVLSIVTTGASAALVQPVNAQQATTYPKSDKGEPLYAIRNDGSTQQIIKIGQTVLPASVRDLQNSYIQENQTLQSLSPLQRTNAMIGRLANTNTYYQTQDGVILPAFILDPNGGGYKDNKRILGSGTILGPTDSCNADTKAKSTPADYVKFREATIQLGESARLKARQLGIDINLTPLFKVYVDNMNGCRAEIKREQDAANAPTPTQSQTQTQTTLPDTRTASVPNIPSLPTPASTATSVTGFCGESIVKGSVQEWATSAGIGLIEANAAFAFVSNVVGYEGIDNDMQKLAGTLIRQNTLKLDIIEKYSTILLEGKTPPFSIDTLERLIDALYTCADKGNNRNVIFDVNSNSKSGAGVNNEPTTTIENNNTTPRAGTRKELKGSQKTSLGIETNPFDGVTVEEFEQQAVAFLQNFKGPQLG